MGLSPMALSKHVSQLEATLEEPLFERSTRSVRLTEFGRIFLERAGHLVQEQEALKEWLENRQGEPTGTLKVIGLERSLQAMVIPYVSGFLERYPRVELEIDTISDLNDPLSRPFDVAWGLSKYLGELYPGLVRRRLLTTPFGVFGSLNYLEAWGTPEHPDDLVKHRVISQLHDKPNDVLIVRGAGLGGDDLPYCHLKAPVKAATGHLEMCIQGLGLINASPGMPEVQRALKAGWIVPVLERYWFESDLYLYYHQTRQRQPKVDAFVDFFADQVEDAIHQEAP